MKLSFSLCLFFIFLPHLVSAVGSNCYQWYIAGTSPLDSASGSDSPLEVPFSTVPFELRVWVTDMSPSDASEKAKTAYVPSTVSAEITREFHSLGIVPRPTWPDDAGLVIVNSTGSELPSTTEPDWFDGTDPDSGLRVAYWSTYLRTTVVHQVWHHSRKENALLTALADHQIPISMDTHNIDMNLLGCSIANPSSASAPDMAEVPILSVHKFSLPLALQTTTFPPPGVTTQSARESLNFHTDFCSRNIGAMWYTEPTTPSLAFALSQSTFASWTAYLAPACPPGATQLYDFTTTPQSAILLTDAGLCRSPLSLEAMSDLAVWTVSTFVNRTANATHPPTCSPPPDLGSFGFKGPGACDAILDKDGRPSLLNEYRTLYSTRVNATAPLWFTSDGGQVFQAISLPAGLSGSVKVRGSVPLLSYRRLATLVVLVDRAEQLWLYDLEWDGWSLGFEWTADATRLTRGGCSPRLMASGAGSGELLIGGADLWYSPNGGVSAHRVTLISSNTTVGELNAGECIVNMQTDVAGDFGVYTSQGRVFYGSMGVAYAYELVMSASTGTPENILDFTSGDRLYLRVAANPLTTNATANPTVTSTIAPVRSTLQASEPECPLVEVEVTSSLTNYIDIGENLTIVARVVPQDEDTANSINVAPAQPPPAQPITGHPAGVSVLTTTPGVLWDPPAAWGSLSDGARLNATISHRQTTVVITGREGIYSDYVAREEHTQGESDVRVGARAANLRCDPVEHYARIRIGPHPPHTHICPSAPLRPASTRAHVIPAATWRAPGLSTWPPRVTPHPTPGSHPAAGRVPPKRHLAVMEATGDRAVHRLRHGAPAYATFDAGSVSPWNASWALTNVSYDLDTYGCPFLVYHGTDGWRPRLGLYDDGVFLREVAADYVLYEVNGRIDWTYNATDTEPLTLFCPGSGMQAGCKYRSQDWAERFALQTSRDPDTAWLPADYRRCTQAATGVDLLANPWHPYSIINSTGISAIKFLSAGRDGTFVFKIRVIDPDFSLCELTAYVGLDVYGAPISPALGGSLLGIVYATIFVGLATSFVVYRWSRLHGKKN
ncbi:hypothetical protein PAPYR_2962 [Paratrimastix pyriformis]|uniref:CATSPERD/E C-terminal domain-containing protein n=1 Tax=Paratrimastix pyriformis TaxID=342808 RepID=A0ABQ8UTP0_9EUKA|nr:hypothetical protein PAPYR_2962 [Paratrimastix pyriformis]